MDALVARGEWKWSKWWTSARAKKYQSDQVVVFYRLMSPLYYLTYFVVFLAVIGIKTYWTTGGWGILIALAVLFVYVQLVWIRLLPHEVVVREPFRRSGRTSWVDVRGSETEVTGGEVDLIIALEDGELRSSVFRNSASDQIEGEMLDWVRALIEERKGKPGT